MARPTWSISDTSNTNHQWIKQTKTFLQIEKVVSKSRYPWLLLCYQVCGIWWNYKASKFLQIPTKLFHNWMFAYYYMTILIKKKKNTYTFSRTIPLAWEAPPKGLAFRAVPKCAFLYPLSCHLWSRRWFFSLRAVLKPLGLPLGQTR